MFSRAITYSNKWVFSNKWTIYHQIWTKCLLKSYNNKLVHNANVALVQELWAMLAVSINFKGNSLNNKWCKHREVTVVANIASQARVIAHMLHQLVIILKIFSISIIIPTQDLTSIRIMLISNLLIYKISILCLNSPKQSRMEVISSIIIRTKGFQSKIWM
jgi:hypothetical protein